MCNQSDRTHERQSSKTITHRTSLSGLDSEIQEEIETQNKLLAKFKKSKKAHSKIQYLIKDKNKTFVVGKLNENIGKPKELWKSLKSLGLPSRRASPSAICLEKNRTLSFDSKTNSEIFRDFFSNLASDLSKKLPSPPTQETYGKGPEYYFLNSAFCTLLEMQTYFWIKFGLSTEIGEYNLFLFKILQFWYIFINAHALER